MFTRRPAYEVDSSLNNRSKPPRRRGRLVREEWNELWEILVVCWSTDPKDRPTATELEARLSEIARRSFLPSSFLMADATQAE